MNARPLLLASAALTLLAGCGVTVEVQTDPISQAIPVTSLRLDTFAEIAVDIPPEARGDIIIRQISGDVTIVNPASSTDMNLSLRLSTQGTATPDTPYLFTAANKPAYFDSAIALLGPKVYTRNSRTPERVPGRTEDIAAFASAVRHERIWLIVGNTITSLGLGELLPQEIRLEGLVVHVVVDKSLQGLSNGMDVAGL